MKHLIVGVLFLASIAYGGDLANLKIGESVPTFSLRNYDNKEHDLKKILKENKLAVLMFVSTDCPVSNAYNERMVKLYDSFTKRGIAFVGINSNKAEDVKMIAKHSKENKFNFPVLKDQNNKVADLFGAQVTPEVYVVDSEGKLLYHGRIDDSRNPKKVTSNDLSDALDMLLAGKELTVTELKAFGCTIKRVSAD